MSSFYSGVMIRNAGYFYIHLKAIKGRRFFDYNDDRAFFLLQIQELLSHRGLLSPEEYPLRFPLAIDLLAFSVLPSGVRLLMYSLDRESANYFIQDLLGRFRLHLRQHQAYALPKKTPSPQLKKLHGVHHALAMTAYIHTRHEQLSETPYSSLGFYLYDRRGDWMRIWRLTRLYKNNPDTYLDYVVRSQQPRFTETSARG